MRNLILPDSVLLEPLEEKDRIGHPTDLAIFLSPTVSNRLYESSVPYWISDKGYRDRPNYIDKDGQKQTFYRKNLKESDVFVRLIKPLEQDEFKNYQGKYITYGEFPQSYVGEKIDSLLEDKRVHEELFPTGKVYNLKRDSLARNTSYKEYYWNGLKYVRLEHDKSDVQIGGLIYQNKDYFYFLVEPIEWLHFSPYLVSKKCLVSNACSSIYFSINHSNNEVGSNNLYPNLSQINDYVSNTLTNSILPSMIPAYLFAKQKEALFPDLPKTVEEYLTHIEERTRLLRNLYTESDSYFSDILDCVQKIREEIPKEYQKRK